MPPHESGKESLTSFFLNPCYSSTDQVTTNPVDLIFTTEPDAFLVNTLSPDSHSFYVSHITQKMGINTQN